MKRSSALEIAVQLLILGAGRAATHCTAISSMEGLSTRLTLSYERVHDGSVSGPGTVLTPAFSCPSTLKIAVQYALHPCFIIRAMPGRCWPLSEHWPTFIAQDLLDHQAGPLSLYQCEAPSFPSTRQMVGSPCKGAGRARLRRVTLAGTS